MDKDRVREVVEYLEHSLHENGIAPAEVVLFGSRNGGTPHEESDVELIIVSKAFENKDILERSEMVASSKLAVIRKFLAPLDVIFLTPDEFEEDPTYASMVATP